MSDVVTGIVPVSVVIPAYNAAETLADAIASIRSSTVQPSEILVVDDASTDRTREIALELGARVVSLDCNGGPARARNAGVCEARSPWVAFLDADDRWMPQKLQKQWQAIESWPEISLCITDYIVHFTSGQVLKATMQSRPGYAGIRSVARIGTSVLYERASFLSGFVRSMFLRQSSVIVRREAFLHSGGYNEDLRLGEDYEFFLRLAGSGAVAGVEEDLVLYLRRVGSLSADPVAEIESINSLWAYIETHRDKYAAEVVDGMRAQRSITLWDGSIIALQHGAIDHAHAFVRAALAIQTSAKFSFLLCVINAIRLPAGRTLFEATRFLCRSRKLILHSIAFLLGLERTI
jgi:glycosyltransferase involved in cell wall biosynthesis